MATSTASHRPVRGILKKGNTDSTVLSTAEPSGTSGPSGGAAAGAGSGEELSKKSQKWDEVSILATYHPANKNYGLMNIEEPNTPYHSISRESEEEDVSDSEIPETMVPEFLAHRLAMAQGKEPKFLIHWGETSEDEEDLKRQFELKRKLHYNEGLNIKFARQLISRELLSDTDTEDQDPRDQEMQEDTSGMENTAAEASQGEVPAEDHGNYNISNL